LVRRLDGTISDVAIGGGGRFLILTLKNAAKLVVFDVNAADIVKTIPLPSANVLVAAGARKLLVAFPEERLLQRWDLATLQREGGSRISPIDGRLIRLALGSDSDGPALALWSPATDAAGQDLAQFSFIDPDSLTVPRVGLVATRGTRCSLSTSGGSFVVVEGPGLSGGDLMHVRAAAGGDLFGIWSGGSPSGFRTISMHGRALIAPYEHISCGHLVPGPDGRTVFTGFSGRLDLDGNPVAPAAPSRKGSPEATVPSSDPSCWLSIGGLADTLTGYVDNSFPNRRSPAQDVTISIHAADGSRLLTIHGLDEMASEFTVLEPNERAKNDFTLDKRLHFVPAAQLLITIPPENDRLVLRQLDLENALDRVEGNYLIVTSPPIVSATAGQTFEHRIAARSKRGEITCALTSGPDGLKLSSQGQLTWPVPQKLAGEDVTAVISVQDATGQKRSHTLAISVK
jgi:hypothetical protein